MYTHCTGDSITGRPICKLASLYQISPGEWSAHVHISLSRAE